MGEFSFVNIFTTKGVEYLWIIGYLLLLVALAPMLLRLGDDKGESKGDNGGDA